MSTTLNTATPGAAGARRSFCRAAAR
jgi:hypothetical protein